MRNTLRRILTGLVLAALLVTAGAVSAGAEEINPAPADLLGAAYNPFAGVILPDGYTVMQAVYEQKKQRYVLHIQAADTAEGAVSFVLDTLGFADPKVIAMSTDVLQSMGAVGVESADAATGVRTSGEINNYGRDQGYNIMLYQTIADSTAMDAFLASNTNREALSAVAGSLDFSAAEQVRMTLYMVDSTAIITYQFQLENAADVKAELIEAHKESYIKTGDRLAFRYGDMETQVKFSAVADGSIEVEQQMKTMDVCFGSYVPPLTLRNLGFDDWREQANCDYHDDANDIYLRITKSEWGESENPNDANSIGFSKGIGDGGYRVSYDPQEQTYRISLDLDKRNVEYTCIRSGGRLTYIIENGVEDTADLAGRMFPDADNALYEAVAQLEAYISDTFGMTPDELYAVAYE